MKLESHKKEILQLPGKFFIRHTHRGQVRRQRYKLKDYLDVKCNKRIIYSLFKKKENDKGSRRPVTCQRENK